MSVGITLEQLLLSRDNRSEKQKKILKENPHLTLICTTVVIPGNVKRNSHSLIIAKAALESLIQSFSEKIIKIEELDLTTGYEIYLLTSLPVVEAKKITCLIEDTHPLGRLFDIDVIGRDGLPVQRESLGFQARRCLLCNNPARFCMRNNTHTQEEINLYIKQLVDTYVHRI